MSILHPNLSNTQSFEQELVNSRLSNTQSQNILAIVAVGIPNNN